MHSVGHIVKVGVLWFAYIIPYQSKVSYQYESYWYEYILVTVLEQDSHSIKKTYADITHIVNNKWHTSTSHADTISIILVVKWKQDSHFLFILTWKQIVMSSQEGTLSFKWWGWSNGGKNQNPKKSLGLQTKSKKIPGPKINPPKIPCRISKP